MDWLLVLATWLHTVALVIAWGYYGVLGRIVIPGIERSVEPAARGPALAAIERQALPLVAVSAVLFIATGTYLLFANPWYDGLGNVFASTWTTLMAIKHVLVIGFVALGVFVDRRMRRLEHAARPGAATELAQVRLAAEAATGLGALIVLLTTIAQVAS